MNEYINEKRHNEAQRTRTHDAMTLAAYRGHAKREWIHQAAMVDLLVDLSNFMNAAAGQVDSSVVLQQALEERAEEVYAFIKAIPDWAERCTGKPFRGNRDGDPDGNRGNLTNFVRFKQPLKFRTLERIIRDEMVAEVERDGNREGEKMTFEQVGALKTLNAIKAAAPVALADVDQEEQLLAKADTAVEQTRQELRRLNAVRIKLNETLVQTGAAYRAAKLRSMEAASKGDFEASAEAWKEATELKAAYNRDNDALHFLTVYTMPDAALDKLIAELEQITTQSYYLEARGAAQRLTMLAACDPGIFQLDPGSAIDLSTSTSAAILKQAAELSGPETLRKKSDIRAQREQMASMRATSGKVILTS